MRSSSRATPSTTSASAPRRRKTSTYVPSAPSGFPTSWPIPAARRPIPASFSERTSWPCASSRWSVMLAERLNRMTDHLLDAQGQLVRSEKLAGIGRLAAGIGHEVGNPLGALGTYAEVVDGVARELERIDRIVRGLLDYARPHEEALAPVDPAAVARGAYGLLEAQGALRPARAALDLEPGIPHILGRAHLLEQAIVNLVLNAVDAAPGGIVILGGRPWDYQPHQPNPKRATDPAPARFPRATERRPVRPEF